MITSTEKRIVNLRNEVKALKVASELAYSQLLMPENTPSVSYSGTVTSASVPRYATLARCKVRFTRSDGSLDVPFVNFTLNFRFSPTYTQFMASWGIIVEGNDTEFSDEQVYDGYIAGSGPGYVDYYVDISTDIVLLFDPFTSIDFSFEVEAISMVSGTLTVERVV